MNRSRPMRSLLQMTVCAAAVAQTFCGAADLSVGAVVFRTDFEGADSLAGWTAPPLLDAGRNGGRAMVVKRAAEEEAGGAFTRFELPVARVRGCVLNVSGWIRAEDVSAPPKSWNGIKYMIPIVREGGRQYPQAQVSAGTFDWRHVIFAVRVPEDATRMDIHLGLEAVSGSVWFDDLEIMVRKLPFRASSRVTAGPAYRGHTLPRLRGAMVSPRIDQASLKLFAQDWNANVIRWQLVGWTPKGSDFDLDRYDRWLTSRLDEFDKALPLCREYRLLVVLDLHSQPVGGPDSGKGLFNSAECQQRFIDNWRMMARRYRGNEVIWAYDLANEPQEKAVLPGLMDWQELCEAAAKAVREVDPETAIIVEPPSGGGPDGFVCFNPIDVPNVLYSVHMYLPHTFTHQGVHGKWTQPCSYPGEIGGRQWDKTRLRQALKPAIDFQKRFNVHMYVGEFSAIRWAPDNSAWRYLHDCIEIFEELGWDWTYHAFREWNGWSVEHGPDRENREPAVEPTERQRLILEWFAKNKRPEWRQDKHENI